MIQKNEEVIIKKKGEPSERVTIIVDGDNISINGKPVDEYENKNVIILKKKINGRESDFDAELGGPNFRRLFPEGMPKDFNMNGRMMMDNAEPKALLGVMTEKYKDGGAKIIEVTKESGAEKAGLAKDDVITKIGASKIETPDDLVEEIGKLKPNEKVDIIYQRNGKENKATAVLGENKVRSYAFNFDSDDFDVPNMDHFKMGINRTPKMGLQIQDMEEGKGVMVKGIEDNLPASKAGLKAGDIILQLEGKDIQDVDMLKRQLSEFQEGDSFKVVFKRNNAEQTTTIKLPKKLKTADL